MALATSAGSDGRKPLRLWPGVALAASILLVRYVVPLLSPGALRYGLLGAFLGVLAILLWWLIFSRAAWWERLGAVVVAVAGMAFTPRFLDASIAKGNLGYQFFLHGIPLVSVALVIGAMAGRRLARGARFATVVAAILLGCGVWTLLRSQGVTSNGMAQFAWRWAETPEERLLERADDEVAKTAPAPESGETPATWPGFRGPGRDGVVHGLRIATDWSQSPPVALWRRAVGPGVSSFAVARDRFFTQEQRGDDEVVTCYEVATGEPVWRHRAAARFTDPHVGSGPRATPALAAGRVITLGATGILNALDAGDGTLLWTRDAGSDTGANVPLWGFVSSPLVIGDEVVVQAGKLVAYDLATGAPRWFGPDDRGSYGSPQLVTIDAIPQVLLMTHAGLISVSPDDGTLLWEHPWRGIGMVQPASTGDGGVLISTADAGAAPVGTRSVAITHAAERWSATERWTSNGLKPSFSDLVVHRGHAFGFDGSFLACIDLENGERRWKGGRYGEGEILLLAEQDLLLVLSERGELALVAAQADRFAELARFPAIEGRTWNQPALAGDVILVRNGETMAAFRLPSAARGIELPADSIPIR